MLLTPLSLMSFIASSSFALDVVDTTAECRFKEGRAKVLNAFDEYWWNEGVSLAYAANQASRLRSETTPAHSFGSVVDHMRTKITPVSIRTKHAYR